MDKIYNIVYLLLKRKKYRMVVRDKRDRSARGSCAGICPDATVPIKNKTYYKQVLLYYDCMLSEVFDKILQTNI